MHPLDARLQAIGQDASANDRLEVIWEFYEAKIGHQLRRPLSIVDRQAVRDFLRELRRDNDSPDLIVQRTHIAPAASLSLTEKAWMLVQQRCKGCELVVHEDGVIPLQIV